MTINRICIVGVHLTSCRRSITMITVIQAQIMGDLTAGQAVLLMAGLNFYKGPVINHHGPPWPF